MNNNITEQLESLIKVLESGEKRIVYQSSAELFEKNPSINFMLSAAVAAFKDDNFEKGILSVIKCLGLSEMYSSEILSTLIFMLAEEKEFYYSGLLVYYTYHYFLSGNTKDVAPLDLPYYDIAFQISKNRYYSMESAYKMALEVGSFVSLESYSQSLGYGKNMKRLSEKDSIEDIRKYYDKIDHIQKKEIAIISSESIKNQLARKTYNYYSKKKGLFPEYISSLCLAIDKIIIFSEKSKYNEMSIEIDRIREMYRKTMHIIFQEISDCTKHNFGSYFIEDFIYEYLRNFGVTREEYNCLKDFHGLANAIGHLTEVNTRRTPNAITVNDFILKSSEKKKSILISMLLVIDRCHFSDGIISTFNDMLEL